MWRIVRNHPKKTVIAAMTLLIAGTGFGFLWYIFYWDCTYFAKEIREDVMVRNGMACVRLTYPYPDWIEIKGADPYTISEVDATVLNIFRDKESVYVRDKKIEGADPASVEGVTKYMWKDKNHVYIGTRVTPADPTTLQLLDGSYYRDAKSVYYNLFALSFVDPTSFEVMGDQGYSADYAKDKNRVYFRELVVEGADPTLVTMLDHGYWKDINRVYYEASVLPLVDPSSFETIGEYGQYAKDRNRVYYRDFIIEGADPETFQNVLRDDSLFWRDKSGIYLRGKAIEGVDRETFVVIQGGRYSGFGRDEFHCYDPYYDERRGEVVKIHELSACQ